MNSMLILDALGSVDDAYILSAAQRLGYTQSSGRRTFPMRRFAACIAAVLLLLSTSFVTAMAVSEEFREFIYSFFRAEEPEVVPAHTTPIPESSVPPEDQMAVEPEKIVIGDVIESTYVHTPMASHARNGVFLICTDEVMMNSGNHYDAYAEENGELVKLEEYTFSEDYTILGNSFHVEFQWVDANGTCVYTYIDSHALWGKPNLSGPLEATLFTFPCQITGADGTEYATSYPVLINLRTGELTDILAGAGVENIPGIYQAAISEDLTRMVLVTWDEDLYYVDIPANKLYSVDELSGEHAEECALTGTTLTCWKLEKDPDLKHPEYTLGTFKIWTIDLNTMERRDLYDAIPSTADAEYASWAYSSDSGKRVAGLHFIEGFNRTSHWGNMYSGSKFAVEVNEARNVYVIDLATGQKSIIEGFQWPELQYPDIECIPSPDGEKLLIQWRTSQTYYDYIGVLDFSAGTYIEFSRENLNDVNEHTIYWFDNESILIATGHHEDTTDYYIYRLLN